MFRFIGRYFKNVWHTLTNALNNIMDGVEQKDPTKKTQGINSLIGFLLFRLLFWGIPGIYLSIRGLLGEYLKFIMAIYGVGALLAWGTEDEPPAPAKPAEPPLPTADEAAIMRHAEAELDIILDIAQVTLSAAAKHHAIEVPRTKDELAYPKKSECIRLDNGVPVISVMVRQSGEVNSAEICEDFNLILGQLFDGNQLPKAPAPVYWDANQNAIQSIQAVNHYIVGRFIILDIVHVKDEGSATYVKSHAPRNTDGSEAPLPPTSPYFG